MNGETGLGLNEQLHMISVIGCQACHLAASSTLSVSKTISDGSMFVHHAVEVEGYSLRVHLVYESPRFSQCPDSTCVRPPRQPFQPSKQLSAGHPRPPLFGQPATSSPVLTVPVTLAVSRSIQVSETAKTLDDTILIKTLQTASIAHPTAPSTPSSSSHARSASTAPDLQPPC